MSTKISGDELRTAVKNILADKDKVKFHQTIDLQIKLRNYDPKKDKRFAGSFKLPNDIRKNHAVCILGDKSHCDKAKELGLAHMDQEAMKKLNKNKKLVKKLSEQYRAFLASETLIKQIPRILGPGLSKAGKFPSVLNNNDDIKKKVEELQKTVKFQFKKEICIGTAVGHVGLTEDELYQNINAALNYFVSLLKKNWQNIGTVIIKTSMGKPQHIFPPGQITK
jgi:large subunit ribosomal protein L10Ae